VGALPADVPGQMAGELTAEILAAQRRRKRGAREMTLLVVGAV
jgi:hypothetical protein